MLIGGMVAAVGVALLTERFAYRPLRNAPRLAPLITAIGVSIFLQEFVRLFFGRIPGFPDSKRAIPFPQIDVVTGPAIQIGELTIQRARPVHPGDRLAICTVILYFFVNRTRLGRAMQATSQDPDTARLMGINVDRIIMVAFAVGAALAAVAGLAYGLRYTNIDFRMGFLAGLKAFTAAVLGGIGNINGAVVGGLVLGVVEVLATAYIPGHLRRFGLEGRLGVRAADPGAGVPTPRAAGREGGGPSMNAFTDLAPPELSPGSTRSAASSPSSAGSMLIIFAPFLPWSYALQRVGRHDAARQPLTPAAVRRWCSGCWSAASPWLRGSFRSRRQATPGRLGSRGQGRGHRCAGVHRC